jgi:hypothetical protein
MASNRAHGIMARTMIDAVVRTTVDGRLAPDTLRQLDRALRAYFDLL